MTYDRMPREEVLRGLRGRRMQEKYVRVIKECNRDATTSVRSTVGKTDGLKVGVSPEPITI